MILLLVSSEIPPPPFILKWVTYISKLTVKYRDEKIQLLNLKLKRRNSNLQTNLKGESEDVGISRHD